MRAIAVAVGIAAMTLATGAWAQSVNGTVNSNIGGAGAHAGVNGDLHSGANADINARAGSRKSMNGLYNSTVGPAGAHAGVNGKLHSSGNRTINRMK